MENKKNITEVFQGVSLGSQEGFFESIENVRKETNEKGDFDSYIVQEGAHVYVKGFFPKLQSDFGRREGLNQTIFDKGLL